MNRQQQLAKKTAVIALSKLLTQFTGFFLMPLYTGLLTSQEYGVIDLIATYTTLALPMVIFQIDQALFRWLVDARNDEAGKKRIVSAAFFFMLGQIVVCVAVFLVLQPLLASDYKWYLLLGIVSAVCLNMMLNAARGLGSETTYAAGSFIAGAFQIIGNLLSLLVFGWGLPGMLLSSSVAQLLAAAFIFLRLRLYRYMSIRAFRRSSLMPMLQYSVPLIPNALSWWITDASDRTVVLLFLGASYNGLLSVGHKFSGAFMTVYYIFNVAWIEIAAMYKDDSDKEEFFSNITGATFKLFACIGIGLMALMPFLFPLLVNESFHEAYGIVPLLLLGAILHVLSAQYGVIYVALKRTKEIAKTSLLASVINIVVHLALVKWIGLYAAAVSTITAFGVMVLYRHLDLKKSFRLRSNAVDYIVLSLLLLMTLIAYYSGVVFLQIVVALAVVLVSAVMNRQMLRYALKMLRSKLHWNR